METPVQIDFQGTAPSPAMYAHVEKHLEGLEARFGRITAGRVVVKAPGEHHRTGGPYEINIRLSLPEGREVNISRTAKLDERHSNAEFAINDAFKRARRQLQDQVRRLRGQVKHHEELPIGTVTKLNQEDGFGFLESSDGREIYFHQNSVLNGAFARIEIGTRVVFNEESGEKGPQASTVKLLGKHGMR